MPLERLRRQLAEQMAALAPYREQAAKAAHRKLIPQTVPVAMQQYAIHMRTAGQPTGISQVSERRQPFGSFDGNVGL